MIYHFSLNCFQDFLVFDFYYFYHDVSACGSCFLDFSSLTLGRSQSLCTFEYFFHLSYYNYDGILNGIPNFSEALFIFSHSFFFLSLPYIISIVLSSESCWSLQESCWLFPLPVKIYYWVLYRVFLFVCFCYCTFQLQNFLLVLS